MNLPCKCPADTAHEAGEIKVVECVVQRASEEEFDYEMVHPLDRAGVVGVCGCDLTRGDMVALASSIAINRSRSDPRLDRGLPRRSTRR